MAFESFIGLRYLKARRQTRMISTITLISIGGVALGVCALFVILAVIAGYESELRDKIIGANAHGNILKMVYGFNEYEELIEKIEALDEVQAASPFILREVMVSSEAEVTGALIKGVDRARLPKVTSLPKMLIEGDLSLFRDEKKLLEFAKAKTEALIEEGEIDRASLSRAKRRYGEEELPAIMIGHQMAKHLKLSVGDEVNVVNPLGGGIGATGPIPSNRYFRIAAIFNVGMYDYDMQFVYCDLRELQDFALMDDNITAIEFKVKERWIGQTGDIAEKIAATLGDFPYRVRDWRDLNRNLFAALKLQRIVMFIILSFIILVASFGVTGALIMIVIDKKKEIAILKSMGASKFSIMKIFVIDGFVIGTLGTALGLLLGIGACGLIPLIDYRIASDIYFISKLSAKIEPLQVAAIVISALSISLVATLYPSYKAAKLDPVAGLRND